MAPIIQTQVEPSPSADQRWHGRLYAPDPRDRLHTMEKALRAMSGLELQRRKTAPMRGPTLDQGPTPRCVMFSAATALAAAPTHYTRDPIKALGVVEQVLDGHFGLYTWAQHNDEWPGIDYDGTSVRAGQEYLRKIGKSGGYVFARTNDEAKDYISRVGSAPIVLGIDWVDGFDVPFLRGKAGQAWLEPSGPVVGGHAICALWYNAKMKAWKLQNTWGRDWGDDGVVYMADDVFEYFVFQANGEAVSFTELKAA